MNPLLNMEQHKNQFTQNELRIYQAILENPEQVTYQSTNKLAENLGVSQPALTRFIKVLGYQKYQEFRSDITSWLARQNTSSNASRSAYFERLDALLKEAEEVLTPSYMKELADYVLSGRELFASGIGKSISPAYLMESLFRKHSIFVHTADLGTLHEVSDHLEHEDMIILFSVSAQKELLSRVENTEARILLITTNAAHAYQNVVDKTVVLPYLPPDPELSSISPVLFNIFVELLDRYVSKKLSD